MRDGVSRSSMVWLNILESGTIEENILLEQV